MRPACSRFCKPGSAGEYLRDVIQRDKERVQQQAFDRLKVELSQAYAAPGRPIKR